MQREPTMIELSCSACSWYQSYSSAQLGEAFPLEGTQQLTPAVVKDLVSGRAPEMTCPECGVPGLQSRVVCDDDAGDEFWQEAVTCEVCRKPIPLERLEALPAARRCVACQTDSEAGKLAEEVEYCPRCGALLQLRVKKSGGLTQYKLFCTGSPACRL